MKRMRVLMAMLLGMGLLCSVNSFAEDDADKEKGKDKDKGAEQANPAMDRFKKIDTDGNGEISLAEFKAARERDSFGEERFKKMDADGNGEVSLEEFTAPMTAHFKKIDADGNGSLTLSELKAGADGGQIEEMFKKIDADGNGSISPDEMHKMHRGRPEGHGPGRDGDKPGKDDKEKAKE